MALSPQELMPVDDKLSMAGPAAQQNEMPAAQLRSVPSANSSRPDNGTRALLQAGFWIMLVALLALVATETIFGGLGIDGPHTNAGWLAFMFALMGAPFGLLLLVLGGAKWLRNRRMQHRRAD